MTNGWHLDKRVPVTIIGVIVLQSLTLGWWASNLDSRMTALELQQKEARKVSLRVWDRIRAADQKASGIDKELASLVSSMKNVERDIGRIFIILDNKRKSEK